MIFVSKTCARINSVIGILRYNGFSEITVNKFKAHKFDENYFCIMCKNSLYSIQNKILSGSTRDDILTCNEMMIKKMLE